MANKKRLDLIERNALISEFEWLKSVVNESSKDEIQEIIQRIENVPTVDAVEVVHGRWIYEPVEFSIVKDIRCSVCGRYVVVPDNYCPNCGAKMDGDGNA